MLDLLLLYGFLVRSGYLEQILHDEKASPWPHQTRYEAALGRRRAGSLQQLSRWHPFIVCETPTVIFHFNGHVGISSRSEICKFSGRSTAPVIARLPGSAGVAA
jgi:hypothetical protein